MLKFHGDAIELSGSTGTKLKSEIIGKYYEMWWSITSGGNTNNHSFPTSIVELNSGTGEDYIEDTGETILGSSGHALALKFNRKESDTDALKIVLVEENEECFDHLIKVINRRWPEIKLEESMKDGKLETSGVTAIKSSLRDALDQINRLSLGNSIFFFDPLLYVSYSDIGKVADNRIKKFYQRGTEFVIFVFTSDWFVGRESLGLLPLPDQMPNESEKPMETILELDNLFGDQNWRRKILTSNDIQTKIDRFVSEYKIRLHRWFRYVLALPFEPKEGQLYHLFFTSNYEDGIDISRRFYQKATHNPRYDPSNSRTYQIFRDAHPGLVRNLTGREKPAEWKVLWKIIKNHEEGLCDMFSSDLLKVAGSPIDLNRILEWLRNAGYLTINADIKVNWANSPNIFELDWQYLKMALEIDPPQRLTPLHPYANR
ncbi:MAG: three-Cys-motif partner protein TcmP [Candidatus Thermoplasmatota archaeon]|nr:three-Cys-motif partner protein TcmP [Candidatus Thermoplasmatota archaeon]